MKHIRKYNEAFARPMRAKESELIDQPSPQDIVHWEMIIKDGRPYMKVSTDLGVYYSEIMTEKDFNKI